jgi:hypothetical protein
MMPGEYQIYDKSMIGKTYQWGVRSRNGEMTKGTWVNPDRDCKQWKSWRYQGRIRPPPGAFYIGSAGGRAHLY